MLSPKCIKYLVLFSIIVGPIVCETSEKPKIEQLGLSDLVQVKHFEIDNDNKQSEEITSDDLKADLLDFTNTLRFATICDTPNHDPGYCIELSKCAILSKESTEKKSSEFIQASTCGPKNEDHNDPKVCCGKYNNFKNVSKIMADDVKILPKKCGTQRFFLRSRIFGGTEAQLGEYPWMVRLIHQNSYGYKTYGCSAFLIHTKYVLTAAHCIESNFTLVRGPVHSAAIGEHNIETKVDCTVTGNICAPPTQYSRVDTIIVHPKYDKNSKDHHYDIALIHLRKGTRLSEFVQPICLPEKPIEPVKTYYVSGWGKTESKEYSPVKLKVNIQPYDKEQCIEKYDMLNLDINSSQICAGGEKGKDSCAGDSGGPLMAYNEETKISYAAGIVSYGIGCGLKGWPAVYTNIPTYIEWIKNNILATSLRTRNPNSKKKHKGKRNHDKHSTTTLLPII